MCKVFVIPRNIYGFVPILQMPKRALSLSLFTYLYLCLFRFIPFFVGARGKNETGATWKYWKQLKKKNMKKSARRKQQRQRRRPFWSAGRGRWRTSTPRASTSFFLLCYCCEYNLRFAYSLQIFPFRIRNVKKALFNILPLHVYCTYFVFIIFGFPSTTGCVTAFIATHSTKIDR